jgi:serine-type D-Ala-D-Ala carboxypeptidase/endopeptidase (penicillin-binding protein 4)
MRRAILLLVCACLFGAAAPAHARPYWKKQIDKIARGRDIGIAVHDEGRVLYRHTDRITRPPASNEKLLMSMALFDRLDPETQLDTRVLSRSLPIAGTITGDVWLAGRGDPTITAGGRFGDALPFEPTKLGALARIVAQSVDRIEGRVMGHTGYFSHDWFAPGWQSYFPADEVALPSALAFEGNTRRGNHIRNPEWRAARAFTRKLEYYGVTVTKKPSTGHMPSDLLLLTDARSVPMSVIVRYMNRWSSNFFAEVLGKRLGVEVSGVPGTIAKGARAIEAFGRRHGVEIVAHDASGLSYRNRVAPVGLVKLLTHVEENEAYYDVLRRGLPSGGQGTLEDRLHNVRLRAKTGSLDGVSALSGWVWLERADSWAEFSIMSSGMPYYTAKGVEDRIVRVLSSLGR